MLPIVFIYKGGDSYLACSLSQAQRLNPQSEVHLVGDTFNRGHAGILHSELAAFSERARRFEALYQHRNTNPPAYELFCFQRWFILEEFLRHRRIDSCLYLDSDVLLFANAEEQARRFKNFDLTLTGISPHCMFIKDRSVLEAFCDFLLEAYTDPKLFRLFEAVYLDSQARGLAGGVCDMTGFGFFRHYGKPKICDLSAVVDGTTYDVSMCDPTQGFEMARGIKRIQWKEHLPYGRLIDRGQRVRLMALHFQGPSKGRIFAHMRCGSWRERTLYYWNRFQSKKGKYRQKLVRAWNTP